MNRAKRYVLTALLVVTLGGVALTIWYTRPHASTPRTRAEDPQQSYAARLRNVRSEVRYVGDAACALCHPEQSEDYKRHPMGRSLAPVVEIIDRLRYDAAARNPFERFGSTFVVQRQGNGLVHKQQRRDASGRTLAELALEVQYAIGSGTRGYTYLVQRGTHLFQSPISWFAQEQTWDLTPGFQVIEQFERPAQAACLFCHCNLVEPVPHTLNQYRLPLFRGHAIGCERCHGPGELHVAAREQGEDCPDPDDTIINPRHLPPVLRDAVCQQCHLQGESRVLRRGRELFDYRPGLPLHEFLSVFVRVSGFSEGTRSNSHAVQMAASRCFRESQGRLSCTSCHDAHRKPEPDTEPSYYRDRCLGCHQETSCSLEPAARRRENPRDLCVDCHMPRAPSANIAHTAVTDHRIMRRAVPGRRSTPAQRLRPGEPLLVHFHQELFDPDDPEVARDLGLALVEVGRNYPNLGASLSRQALPLLEAAVGRAPDDVAAREELGFALWRLGRLEEARTAFEAALELVPSRESALTYAAMLAAAQDRATAAEKYWRRAVAVNPWSSQYRYQLALQLARTGRWLEAREECQHALGLNPVSEEIRTLLVSCCLRSGDREQAHKEFAALLALRPNDAEVLQRWFDEQKR